MQQSGTGKELAKLDDQSGIGGITEGNLTEGNAVGIGKGYANKGYVTIVGSITEGSVSTASERRVAEENAPSNGQFRLRCVTTENESIVGEGRSTAGSATGIGQVGALDQFRINIEMGLYDIHSPKKSMASNDTLFSVMADSTRLQDQEVVDQQKFSLVPSPLIGKEIHKLGLVCWERNHRAKASNMFLQL
ncbi:hypothetical protein FRX31_014043 [Thalictrum thalictroides]|uniref:Uncharacterized protein n=1 Tax=Thalictrum thalictroides TaxID=46969 RepID=A0A7J6WJS1_THATH|nr:hypothetical protein FRX31_014043 [Thalictrum thalictroides]